MGPVSGDNKAVENSANPLPVGPRSCDIAGVNAADALAITFEPGSGRYDRDTQIFRFNAADCHGRIPCAISQHAFEHLAGVKVDLVNARHIFADWEKAVFLEAARVYASTPRAPGEAIALGLS